MAGSVRFLRSVGSWVAAPPVPSVFSQPATSQSTSSVWPGSLLAWRRPRGASAGFDCVLPSTHSPHRCAIIIISALLRQNNWVRFDGSHQCVNAHELNIGYASSKNPVLCLAALGSTSLAIRHLLGANGVAVIYCEHWPASKNAFGRSKLKGNL